MIGKHRYVLDCSLALFSALLWSGEALPEAEQEKELTAKAHAGSTQAQSTLGFRFLVQGKYSDAEKWLRTAAEQDELLSQQGMYILCVNGWGLERDLKQASAWMQRTMRSPVQKNKGREIFQGQSEWFIAAARRGEPVAAWLVGKSIQIGLHPATRPNEDFEWFTLAADKGLLLGKLSIAQAFRDGKGVDQDMKQVVRLYREVAETGDPQGCLYLGKVFFEGEGGVQEDFVESAKWFKIAAENDEVNSQTMLGIQYLAGQGLQKDEQAGFNWLKKAADRGFPIAQSAVGNSYCHGIGVAQDVKEGEKWFIMAARNGDAIAQRELKKRGVKWK